MSEPDFSLSNNTGAVAASSRIIHDLRAPLVVALGYLDELCIVKSDLIEQLSSEGRRACPQGVKDVDAEMSLCLDAIRESLDELDTMMVDLRDKL